MNTKWMEQIEVELTKSCKEYILKKEDTIHGLILFYAQEEFKCWCNYESKKNLELNQTDDWLNDNEDDTYIDYEFEELPNLEDYDEDTEDEVNDLGLLITSIIMSKVVINLKNDTDLKSHFSENLLIGMNLDETNEKPTFYGSYFGDYKPNEKIVNQVINEFVGSNENKELILDLIKESPTGVGLELWNKLSFSN